MAVATPEASASCRRCGAVLFAGHGFCGQCGLSTTDEGGGQRTRGYTGPRRMLVFGLVLVVAMAPLAFFTFVAIQAVGAPIAFVKVAGPIVGVVVEETADTTVDTSGYSTGTRILMLTFALSSLAATVGFGSFVTGTGWLTVRAIRGRKVRTRSTLVQARTEFTGRGRDAVDAGGRRAGQLVPAAERAANRIITGIINRFGGGSRR